MGRDLNGKGIEPTPIIAFRTKVGATFLGRLVAAGKEYKNSRGWLKYIYEFELIETTMPLQKKDGGGYRDIPPTPGLRVSLFATAPMHDRLQGANVGEIIRMEYAGKKPSKSGMFHDVKMKVVDDAGLAPATITTGATQSEEDVPF